MQNGAKILELALNLLPGALQVV